MAFSEDMSVFFSTDEFADEAIFISEGKTYTVNGILNVGDSDVMGMIATKPILVCASVDVIKIRRGDYVAVRGNKYIVTKNTRKATGLSNVELELE